MGPQETITVVIVDDHAVTRRGVRTLLDREPDIEVVGEAADGETALALVDRLRPRILLLDIEMPGPGAAAIQKQVWEHYHGQVHVLILTAHDKDAYLTQALDGHVQGFVLKCEAQQRIIAAIRCAARGEVLFSMEQMQRANEWRANAGACWENLSDRERQVLALLREGHRDEAIAEMLEVTKHTVLYHIASLRRKLGVSSRAQILAWVHNYIPEHLWHQDN